MFGERGVQLILFVRRKSKVPFGASRGPRLPLATPEASAFASPVWQTPLAPDLKIDGRRSALGLGSFLVTRSGAFCFKVGADRRVRVAVGVPLE